MPFVLQAAVNNATHKKKNVSIRSLLAADSACKSTSDTPQEFSFLARLLVFLDA
jgi:hypothetical protein